MNFLPSRPIRCCPQELSVVPKKSRPTWFLDPLQPRKPNRAEGSLVSVSEAISRKAGVMGDGPKTCPGADDGTFCMDFLLPCKASDALNLRGDEVCSFSSSFSLVSGVRPPLSRPPSARPRTSPLVTVAPFVPPFASISLGLRIWAWSGHGLYQPQRIASDSAVPLVAIWVSQTCPTILGRRLRHRLKSCCWKFFSFGLLLVPFVL